MSIKTFRPATSFTERHGLFVALVGGTNSGKTFSALRLARGIAGPKGKIAVLDTEGGRTLHLKDAFAFDVMVMGAPHRPDQYLDAAQQAQDAGYDVLLIDSFSMEWRGVGGVLDWIDEELDASVERARSNAAQKGWQFDEHRARNANKMAASIRPKVAHKLMVAGFLDLRIPIIFSIRGEMTLDPDTKKEIFKPQCNKNFLFEVTVSFRLAQDRKGVIDLSDPTTFKMEGPHRPIFRDGEQLSERHGEMLAAWARGGVAAPAPAAPAAGFQLAEVVGPPFPRTKRGVIQAIELLETADPPVVAANLDWLADTAAKLPEFSDRIAAIRARVDTPTPPAADDDGWPGPT